MNSSKRPTLNTRGFIFPFVMFVVVAGVFVISQIYLYNSTNNDYDEFARVESQANIGLESQATVFRKILTLTNSNGSGTGAGSDNDDYLVTGSGGVGADDDADAFRFRFGKLLPAEKRNILTVDATYCSYSSIPSVASIGSLSLSLDGTGSVNVYAFDSAMRTLASKTISVGTWTNSIDLSGMTIGDSVAVFLMNASTGSSLDYTLSGSGSSGTFSNFSPAAYLGAGKYRYYSNLILQDNQGRFLPFSRVFTN